MKENKNGVINKEKLEREREWVPLTEVVWKLQGLLTHMCTFYGFVFKFYFYLCICVCNYLSVCAPCVYRHPQTPEERGGCREPQRFSSENLLRV